jgi:hypothetical protein
MRWFFVMGYSFLEVLLMRLVLWAAFFVVCNILGVETLKAALTLPMDEAFVPGVLTVPLVGLTAFGVTRVLDAWRERER